MHSEHLVLVVPDVKRASYILSPRPVSLTCPWVCGGGASRGVCIDLIVFPRNSQVEAQGDLGDRTFKEVIQAKIGWGVCA